MESTCEYNKKTCGVHATLIDFLLLLASKRRGNNAADIKN